MAKLRLPPPDTDEFRFRPPGRIPLPEPGVPSREARYHERREYIRNIRRSFLDDLEVDERFIPSLQQFLKEAPATEEGFQRFKAWIANPTKSPSGKYDIGSFPEIDPDKTRRELARFQRGAEEAGKPWWVSMRDYALKGGSIGAQAEETKQQLRVQFGEREAVSPGEIPLRAKAKTVLGAATIPLRATQALAALPARAAHAVMYRPNETGGMRFGREVIEGIAGFAPYAIPGVRELMLAGAGADTASMVAGSLGEMARGEFGPRSEEIIRFAQAGGLFTPMTKGALKAARATGLDVPEEAVPKRTMTGQDALLAALVVMGVAPKFLRGVSQFRTNRAITRLGKVTETVAALKAKAKGGRTAYEGRVVLEQLPRLQAALKQMSKKVSDPGPMGLIIRDITKALKEGRWAENYAAIRRMAEAIADPAAKPAKGFAPGTPDVLRAELAKLSKKFLPARAAPPKFTREKFPDTLEGWKRLSEDLLTDYRMGRHIQGKGRVPRRLWAEEYFASLVEVPKAAIPKYTRTTIANMITEAGYAGRKLKAFLQETIAKDKLPSPGSLTSVQTGNILRALGRSQADFAKVFRAEAALSVFESLPRTEAPSGAFVSPAKLPQLLTQLKRGVAEGLKYRLQRIYPPGEEAPSKIGQAASLATMEPMLYKLPRELGVELGKGALQELRLWQARDVASLARLHPRMKAYKNVIRRLSPEDLQTIPFMVQSMLSKNVPVGKYRAIVKKLTETGGDWGRAVAIATEVLRSQRRVIPQAKIREVQGFWPHEAMKWNAKRLENIAIAYQKMAATGIVPKHMFAGRLQPRLGRGKPIPAELLFEQHVIPFENWTNAQPFLRWFRVQTEKALPQSASARATLFNWAADTLGGDTRWGRKHPLISGASDIFTAMAISSELKLNPSSQFVNMTQTILDAPISGWQAWVKGTWKFATDAKYRKQMQDLSAKSGASHHANIIAYLTEIGEGSPKVKKFIDTVLKPHWFDYTETKINRGKSMGIHMETAKNFYQTHAEQVRMARIGIDLAHFSMGRGFRPELTRLRALRPLTVFTTFQSGQFHYVFNEVLKQGVSGVKLMMSGLKARDMKMIAQGKRMIDPLMRYGGVVGTMYAMTAQARKHGVPIVDMPDRMFRGGLPGVEMPAWPLVPGRAEEGYGLTKMKRVLQAIAGRPETKFRAREELFGQKGEPLLRRIVRGEAFQFPAKRITMKLERMAQELKEEKKISREGYRGEEVLPHEAISRVVLGGRSSRQIAEALRKRKAYEIGEEDRVVRRSIGSQIRRAWGKLETAETNKQRRSAAMLILHAIDEGKAQGIEVDNKMIKSILKGRMEDPRLRMILNAPKRLRLKLMLQLFPKS